LASLLLSFNLLAFLFHTVLDLVDERYRAIRQALGKRRTFFQDLEALLRYFSFNTWDDVLSFMFNGLELNSS
jgi:DNA primase catalytic subunit